MLQRENQTQLDVQDSPNLGKEIVSGTSGETGQVNLPPLIRFAVTEDGESGRKLSQVLNPL